MFAPTRVSLRDTVEIMAGSRSKSVRVWPKRESPSSVFGCAALLDKLVAISSRSEAVCCRANEATVLAVKGWSSAKPMSDFDFE